VDRHNGIIESVKQTLDENKGHLISQKELAVPLSALEKVDTISHPSYQSINEYVRSYIEALGNMSEGWDFGRIVWDWLSNLYIGKPMLSNMDDSFTIKFQKDKHDAIATLQDKIQQEPLEKETEEILESYINATVELHEVLHQTKGIISVVMNIGGNAEVLLSDFMNRLLHSELGWIQKKTIFYSQIEAFTIVSR